MNEIVTDSRALLRLFRQSGYGDMHLRLGDYELFIARPGGSMNPMRAVRSDGVAPAAMPAAAAEPVSAAALLVVAPHIATLVSVLPVGSAVAAGEAVARIELLGEAIDLPAERAGLVSELLAEPGTLVEYAAPLVRLLAA